MPFGVVHLFVLRKEIVSNEELTSLTEKKKKKKLYACNKQQLMGLLFDC